MKRTATIPSTKAKLTSSRAPRRVVVLVATRKSAWLFHGDPARKTWKADGPHFLGHVISHLVLDPRDGRTLLAAAKTGHLGPTVFRSTDMSKTWKEAAQPPAFAKAPDSETGRSVDHTFWLTPAHANEPGVWYAGTSPQGLFRSTDGGISWAPFSSINDDQQFRGWMGTAQDGTPDGPKLHSILIDPRDPQHLYIGMSGGGVHETVDGGRTWKVMIKGMDVVEGFGFDGSQPTFHDPHWLRMCPSNPDRIYQQNHCGIYRLDRPSDTWVRIGRSMPKKWAISVFRWWCIRATTIPRGYFRWTAPACGRAPARTANPRLTAPVMAAKPGSDLMQGCRNCRRGGRSSARR